MWVTRNKGYISLELWREKPIMGNRVWESSSIHSFVCRLNPQDLNLPDDWDGSPIEVEMKVKPLPIYSPMKKIIFIIVLCLWVLFLIWAIPKAMSHPFISIT